MRILIIIFSSVVWLVNVPPTHYLQYPKTINNKTGKFIKRDTVNFLIRRSIYQHGTKATLFLTKPNESAFKSLPDEIVESYGLEVDKFFDNVLK